MTAITNEEGHVDRGDVLVILALQLLSGSW